MPLIIYLCYYDYDDWDSCSHPICFFTNEDEAKDWVKDQNGAGVYQKMTLGQSYAAR